MEPRNWSCQLENGNCQLERLEGNVAVVAAVAAVQARNNKTHCYKLSASTNRRLKQRLIINREPLQCLAMTPPYFPLVFARGSER
jgi:hypothetical protein